jgi:hypothetical protein
MKNPRLLSPKKSSCKFKKADFKLQKKNLPRHKKNFKKSKNFLLNLKKNSPSKWKPKISLNKKHLKPKRKSLLPVNLFNPWPEKKTVGTKELLKSVTKKED